MRKFYISKLLLLVIMVFAFHNLQAQVIINSTPDSIAVLNQPFSYQVGTIVSGNAPTFTLTTKPTGMTISSTGLITWLPESMTAGGKVTITVTNNLGSSTQIFNVYVADQLDCDASIIGYWPMDYMSDTSSSDVSSGYDAVLLNKTMVHKPKQIDTTAIVGKSAYFQSDAIDQMFYYVKSKAPFQFKDEQDFSISLWFRNQPSGVTPLRVEVMAGKYSSTGRWFLLWDHVTKKIEFSVRDVSTHTDTIRSSVTITDNNWHHVVATFDGTAAVGVGELLNLYIDNSNVATDDFDYWTDDFTGDGTFSIGAWNTGGGNSYPFSGFLDEVIYYNKVLTPTDVDALYNLGLDGVAVCLPRDIAPVIISQPTTTITAGSPYSYTIKYKELDGDPIVLSAPVKPAWLSFNETTGVISATPVNANAGNHDVTLAVSDGTTTVNQQFQITVNFNTSSDNNIDNDIISSVFPNPVEDVVNFRLANTGITRIQIFDLSGKLLKEVEVDYKDTYPLSLSQLSKGMYIYKVYQNDNVAIGKINKE